MYTTDFAYDGPFFLVPLSLSYPSSPVLINRDVLKKTTIKEVHLFQLINAQRLNKQIVTF